MMWPASAVRGEALVDVLPRHVRALFWNGSSGDVCEIASIFAVSELDIALFVVENQRSYVGEGLTTKCNLDTAPCHPTSILAIRTLSQSRTTSPSVRANGGNFQSP